MEGKERGRDRGREGGREREAGGRGATVLMSISCGMEFLPLQSSQVTLHPYRMYQVGKLALQGRKWIHTKAKAK